MACCRRRRSSYSAPVNSRSSSRSRSFRSVLRTATSAATPAASSSTHAGRRLPRRGPAGRETSPARLRSAASSFRPAPASAVASSSPAAGPPKSSAASSASCAPSYSQAAQRNLTSRSAESQGPSARSSPEPARRPRRVFAPSPRLRERPRFPSEDTQLLLVLCEFSAGHADVAICRGVNTLVMQQKPQGAEPAKSAIHAEGTGREDLGTITRQTLVERLLSIS